MQRTYRENANHHRMIPDRNLAVGQMGDEPSCSCPTGGRCRGLGAPDALHYGYIRMAIVDNFIAYRSSRIYRSSTEGRLALGGDEPTSVLGRLELGEPVAQPAE